MCYNMMTLKLQYDNFETGEFTEEKTVDRESLLEIFDQNTEIVQVLGTYTIKRPSIKFYIKTREYYLCLMHFTKDAFTVWYCNGPDTKLFAGNFYKKSVRKILELFFDNNFGQLNKIIPRTTKSENSLITSFVTSDFLYTYKKRGVFFLILSSAILLPINYIFLFSIFISHNFILAIMLSISPIASILLFKLHFNYTKNSKNISIKVSSGSPKIVLFYNNEKVEFNKDEIKLLLVYMYSGHNDPFAGYSFSRIILNDKRVFDITSMIIEPYELSYKLSNVATKQISKFYPIIKNYST